MKKKTQFISYKPLKGKTKFRMSAAGRNNDGKITAWHRGGGHPRLYREIDFCRKSTQGVVIGLEYDPNRSAFLARVFNPDTCEHNYIIAPDALKTGDVIRSNSKTNGRQNGHSKQLKYIMPGTNVHNLSPLPSGSGKLLRSPGAFGTVLTRTDSLAKIKLKSGQYRWFNIETIATIGVVGNQDSRFQKLKKAGQSRWKGRRPIVRGVAMNPVDHPHGGGEGKTSGGRPSVTPWGKPTKGPITRRQRKKPKPNATF